MLRIRFFIILMSLCFCGCASVIGGIPGYRHVVVLIVGESKEKILTQCFRYEFKEIVHFERGSLDEVEIMRYALWQDSDIVLYFYENKLVQVQLMDPDFKDIPSVRADYREVRMGNSYPRGYLISSNGKTASIMTLE